METIMQITGQRGAACSAAATSPAAYGRESEPVFIFGMNGSGTTMLLDSIGRHPELYAFPHETRLIPYLYAHREDFGDLSDDRNFLRLWNRIRRLQVFQFANAGAEVPLPENWATYPRDLAGVLDAVFRHFAGREGKSRWCEKTPQHAQHLDALACLFPRARFVHVVRDGRDCAASFYRRWKRAPELTMHRWKHVVRLARRQGSLLGPERYLELRYEELTSDPDFWLRRMCEFAGVAFDPAVLQSSHPYVRPEVRVGSGADLGGLKPNSGNWKTQLPPRRRARVERIGGATLHELGYETSVPEGDVDLTVLERRLYAAKDAVTQYSKEITLKLSGRLERPWTLILSRPLVAWRHRRVNRY